jgi:hypothetical protein
VAKHEIEPALLGSGALQGEGCRDIDNDRPKQIPYSAWKLLVSTATWMDSRRVLTRHQSGECEGAGIVHCGGAFGIGRQLDRLVGCARDGRVAPIDLEDHVELVRCYYNFVEASEGFEIRQRGQDASYASWADHPTADVKGDLHVDDASLVFEKAKFGQSTVLVVVDETRMPLAE